MASPTSTTLAKTSNLPGIMNMKDNPYLRNVPTMTVAITDYRVIDSSLAEVVVATTGNPSRDEMVIQLTSKLKGKATPVVGSFRWLVEGTAAVGYVSTVTPVRALEGESVLSNYKMLASNMYMDPSDDSLWELKEGGSGGRYLARRTQEELPEIMAAAKAPQRTGIPSLSRVVRASVKADEFVSFVAIGGEVDYGVCVGTKEGASVVLSTTTRRLHAVPRERIISATKIDANKLRTPRVTAGMPDANVVIDYWKQVYSYDQEYLNKLVQQVEETAAM